jgi:hypothetical protein
VLHRSALDARIKCMQAYAHTYTCPRMRAPADACTSTCRMESSRVLHRSALKSLALRVLGQLAIPFSVREINACPAHGQALSVSQNESIF